MLVTIRNEVLLTRVALTPVVISYYPRSNSPSASRLFLDAQCFMDLQTTHQREAFLPQSAALSAVSVLPLL
ncbi:hypothetical protein [Gloeocapsopsis dulcis]|uniref:hypothetical protein n=1 Tax=Gloeocapsopsis dulcis TaxID=2859516 RepID=UPI00101AEBE2|nr:hypothetical protein [Gloeocapsopsis dulcis]WNN88065.1 hypothetical protein P0S91_17410 [Gloeocapsopsis dulcis]